MKLKFKIQPFQTSAVESVIDCFAGQVNTSGIAYRIDPGKIKDKFGQQQSTLLEYQGFKNADVQLSDVQVIENIHAVQRRQNLPLSYKLVLSAGCKINLDVEMETGTGKTYCYIKSIFEMKKRYGWSKFIVVVPSIAIREGVYKSLEITAGHFTESYGKKIRFFIYNSKQLHHSFTTWRAFHPMRALTSWSSISRRLMPPEKTTGGFTMNWTTSSHTDQSTLSAATAPL